MATFTKTKKSRELAGATVRENDFFVVHAILNTMFKQNASIIYTSC